jgi:hypothetical protein
MDTPIRIHVLSDGTKSRLVEFPRLNSFEDVNKLSEPTTTNWNILSCFSQRKPPRPRNSKVADTTKQDSRISIPPTIPPLELLKSKMTSRIEARPYAWPMDGAFNPRTTALVIIDMQKDCEFDIIFDDFELEIYLVTFQHLHSLCFTLAHSPPHTHSSPSSRHNPKANSPSLFPRRLPLHPRLLPHPNPNHNPPPNPPPDNLPRTLLPHLPHARRPPS